MTFNRLVGFIRSESLFWISIFFGVLIFIAVSTPNSSAVLDQEIINNSLKVHFIDVGQGDATLMKGPDFTILIDGGRHDRNDLVPYLKTINVKNIDLLIGTHPHSDHIGQFPQILKNFNVDEVWLSGSTHTTRTFERTIDAILNTNAKYHEPRAQENYSVGSLAIEVLHPTDLNEDLNNESIVFKATYKDVIFMFTGDAEIGAEKEILKKGMNLKSDILQIGHHGSNSASSSEFLDRVKPEVAIYSAGWKNGYDHPHPEVLQRMDNYNIRVFGTDIHGTIIISTDGKSFETSI